MDAVDENIEMTKCYQNSTKACIPNKVKCNSHNLWLGLTNHIRNYFENISIKDVQLNSESIIREHGQIPKNSLVSSFLNDAVMK